MTGETKDRIIDKDSGKPIKGLNLRKEIIELSAYGKEDSRDIIANYTRAAEQSLKKSISSNNLTAFLNDGLEYVNNIEDLLQYSEMFSSNQDAPFIASLQSYKGQLVNTLLSGLNPYAIDNKTSLYGKLQENGKEIKKLSEDMSTEVKGFLGNTKTQTPLTLDEALEKYKGKLGEDLTKMIWGIEKLYQNNGYETIYQNLLFERCF